MITSDLDAVLFDMDGTLIDSRENAVRSVQKGLTSLDEDLDETVPVPEADRITSLIGLPSDEYFRRLLPEHLREHADEVSKRIGEFEREGIQRGRVSFYEGIEPLLRSLARSSRVLGLVTNAGRDYFEAHRSSLELDRYFDHLYCIADSPGRNKSELVKQFLDRERHPDTGMIGDRKYDLEAARDHNLPFYGVLWGYGSRDELQDANRLLESPSELADLPIQSRDELLRSG